MEITEGHVEIAKREFLKEESIPVVAGKMMNHVGSDAEFSDLIAIANRGKKEAKNENSESVAFDESQNELLSKTSDMESHSRALDKGDKEIDSTKPETDEIITTCKRSENAKDSWEA